MAIGYALANSIMIDAPEGLIIVDVTETVESGREIFTEFRKISKKPVKAIIYTHQHPDHTWGAKVCTINYFDRLNSFQLTHNAWRRFYATKTNRIATDATPRYAASHQVLLCLLKRISLKNGIKIEKHC